VCRGGHTRRSLDGSCVKTASTCCKLSSHHSTQCIIITGQSAHRIALYHRQPRAIGPDTSCRSVRLPCADTRTAQCRLQTIQSTLLRCRLYVLRFAVSIYPFVHPRSLSNPDTTLMREALCVPRHGESRLCSLLSSLFPDPVL